MVEIIIRGSKQHITLPRPGSSSQGQDYGSLLDIKDQPTEEQEDADAFAWTEKEEAVIIKKIDHQLMSFILILSCVLHMDRTNIANAMSDNMATDLGFTNDDINFSHMVYSILFALVTLPSNIITRKVGAYLLMPILMTSWAVLTWCHAFIHDFTGFMILRALISVTQAGFIPACLVYLSSFYKTKELATRLAYFWGAQAIAGCFSGIMAFGVFHLRGYMGLEGWKWLFIIEGILTHFTGFIAFIYLPESPEKTTRFLKESKGWFTERERHIAGLRVLRDDALKKDQNKPLTWSDVRLTVKDVNLYVHLAITCVGMMSSIPINTYLPSVIRTLGFSVTTANLLAAPAVLIGFFFSIWIAQSSDRRGQVALHGLIGTLWSLLGFCLLVYFLPDHVQGTDGTLKLYGVGKWVFYAVSLFTAASPSWQGMHVAWMSSNLAPEGKRTLALGAVVGAANINGVPGSLIYQTKDAPRYHRGNMICIYLQLTAVFLWLLQRSRYVFINKSRQMRWNRMSEHEKKEYTLTTTDIGNERLDFRFRL